MKFSQVLKECYLTETTISQLVNAIRNKSRWAYEQLGMITDDSKNPLNYNETINLLSKQGIDAKSDAKLNDALRTYTAAEERRRLDKKEQDAENMRIMQSRKGYNIGQERIALAKKKGLL